LGFPHPHSQRKGLAAGERAEKYVHKTGAYASFEEAIQHSLKAVNLKQKEAEKHFPLRNQTEFLFEA
jgi:flagellar hook-basal body complex protein FliE